MVRRGAAGDPYGETAAAAAAGHVDDGCCVCASSGLR